MNKTPMTIMALDAFGKEAVEKILPQWKGQQDVDYEDLIEIAKLSKFQYCSNGEVILPEGYLRVTSLKDKLVLLNALNAFKIFGLQSLSYVSEKGCCPVLKKYEEKFRKYIDNL